MRAPPLLGLRWWPRHAVSRRREDQFLPGVKVPPLEPAERAREVVQGLVAVTAERHRLLVGRLLCHPVAADVMRLSGWIAAATQAGLTADP